MLMSRILFWDIETSPIIAAVWGLYDQQIQYSSVLQDWHVICAAWKWDGDDQVHSITCTGKNDKHVIKKLHSLVSQSDAIVAHNGDNFDWKKLMARVIYHDLPPIPPPIMIDTLKQARKYGFTSRKLDDLGTFLDIGNKLHVERGLWVKATHGDKDAITALETYCRGDIEPLQKLYHKLRPYAPISFNMGHSSNGQCCPKCGSSNFIRRGVRKRKHSQVARFSCIDCRAWFCGKSTIKKVPFND